MKKLSVVCALLLVLTMSGRAQRPVSVSLQQPDETELKFKLTISNPGEEPLTVNVIDKGFGIINSRKTSAGSYFLLYDMRELNDGVYLIEVSGPGGKIVKELRINTVVQETRLVSITDGKKQRPALAF